MPPSLLNFSAFFYVFQAPMISPEKFPGKVLGAESELHAAIEGSLEAGAFTAGYQFESAVLRWAWDLFLWVFRGASEEQIIEDGIKSRALDAEQRSLFYVCLLSFLFSQNSFWCVC